MKKLIFITTVLFSFSAFAGPDSPEDIEVHRGMPVEPSWLTDDPLKHLENEVSDLVSRIEKSNTGKETQKRGDIIVDKIDKLIEFLEKQTSPSSSSGGSNSGTEGLSEGKKPADDSTLSKGPGGSGDLHDKGKGNRNFDDLSP